MPKVHQFPVTVAWSGGRDGRGAVTGDRSGSHVQLAVPEEFGGNGEGTNPEELLVASVASCYSITFGIIAANRKLPVLEVKTQALGEVEETGLGQYKYKKVVIKPHITLARDATDDEMKAAADMAHRADSYCIITNAVRATLEIVVEPDIVKG